MFIVIKSMIGFDDSSSTMFIFFDMELDHSLEFHSIFSRPRMPTVVHEYETKSLDSLWVWFDQLLESIAHDWHTSGHFFRSNNRHSNWLWRSYGYSEEITLIYLEQQRTSFYERKNLVQSSYVLSYGISLVESINLVKISWMR